MNQTEAYLHSDGNQSLGSTVPLLNIRSMPVFDNHEMIIEFSDQLSGLSGYIGIHSTKLGPALGGTRMLTYKSERDGLIDVLNLSKAMSFKCALAGLPFGGGKSVIIQNHTIDRSSALKAYARVIENLRGLFKTGTDVGISDEDVQIMGRFTNHVLGLSLGDREGISTSSIAALGTYYAIKASFQFITGTSDLTNKTIGVKGLGKLGSELVRLLVKDGAVIIAADIDRLKCQKIQEQFPEVKLVTSDTIHSENMDLYAPCALGNEFNDKTISELKTRIIAGGANNQLANDSVGDELWNRGILYAPDYIVNAGGLIYVADELEPNGFQRERVETRTKAIKDTLLELFEQAKSSRLAPNRVANKIGLVRMNQGV